MSATQSPRPIAWEEFSKAELVELLREFERCGFTVGELWSNCDIHTVSDCSCAPIEESLPERVIEIRDRASQRQRRSIGKTPLSQILSTFLGRSEKRQSQLPKRESRLG